MQISMQEYWQGFRDEIVITSLVLIVGTIAAGFFIASDVAKQKRASQTPQTEEALDELKAFLNQQAEPQVAGSSDDVETQAVAPTQVQAEVETLPSPTPDPYFTEVFYGVGGQYQYEGYTLHLSSPRIEFDVRNSSSRSFVVSVNLANTKVPSGLNNQLSATVIKDGAVLVSQAPLSLSEAKVLGIGDSVAYTARLSLIEGTDISQLMYSPGSGQPEIVHVLRP
jgi:hypothetical protein